MRNDHGSDRYRPIARSEIISRAEQLTRQYQSLVRERALIGISFDTVFTEFIYPDYEVRINHSTPLGCDESGNAILGQFDPVAK